jgi:zinc transport system ATP-binding protein
MPGPSVTFDCVALNLGGVSILDQVSFRVEEGALCCIVGPNGGGKTSLVRSLMGQMPHSGVIKIAGEGKVCLGYVPQFLEIDRTLPLTVTDILAIMRQRKPVFLGVKRGVRPEIETVLEKVGFEGKRNRRFGGLSGGERQRVLFAQALMPQPDLLVLDEPTSNMDEAGARRIEELVLALQRQGTTVVWINHDLAQVRRIATEVAVIDRTLLYYGAPSGMPEDFAAARARAAA